MTYVIEHDIEIPPRGGAKYPWEKMGHMDSIPVEEPYEKGKGSAAGSSAASWLKRNREGWEAVTRRDEDRPETHVRVWFVDRATEAFTNGTNDTIEEVDPHEWMEDPRPGDST